LQYNINTSFCKDWSCRRRSRTRFWQWVFVGFD